MNKYNHKGINFHDRKKNEKNNLTINLNIFSC